MNRKVTAIILAGGLGERMKTEKPKQFLEIAGKPVIVHTILKFEKNDLVSDIIIVCPEAHRGKMNKIIEEHCFKKINKVVHGGATRQESSFNGLQNCPSDTEFVLIHDAVRPFVDDRIIRDLLSAAEETGASNTVTDTTDTIIVQKGDFVETIPERNKLKRVQTPQGFRYKTILDAHLQAQKNNIKDATDDCALVLFMGSPVKVVNGSTYNIKITEPIDMYLAEKIFQLEK